tara:strand:+ start:8697 stop:9788 length:1092 start_codon:yes stop_codon:yes gene_type:complete
MIKAKFKNDHLSPDDLLLDPRNPRLFVDESDYICDEDDDYSEDWIQKELLDMLQDQPQHKLQELKHSIREKGFEPFSDIYVRPYGDYYLVFEGNRRTASIKTLLEDEADNLSEDVLESLEEIPVKILDCAEEDQDEVIDSILTTLHLNSSLQWQPMQQAFTYYRMYMELLYGRHGKNTGKFVSKNNYENKLSKQVGRERKDVVQELRVYRLYKQFRDTDYAIDGTMYSMLKEILAKRTMAEEYFEFNFSTFTMSEAGMSYLYPMCLGEGRPISQPKQASLLLKCHTTGRQDLLDQLADQEISFDEAKNELDSTVQANAYEKSLSKINSEFDKLIHKTNFTDSEASLVEKILKHAENLKRTFNK